MQAAVAMLSLDDAADNSPADSTASTLTAGFAGARGNWHQCAAKQKCCSDSGTIYDTPVIPLAREDLIGAAFAQLGQPDQTNW